MADARRAWARALYLALSGSPPAGGAPGDARNATDLDAAARALEGAAAVIAGPQAGGSAGAEAFFLDPAIPRKARAEALAALCLGASPEGTAAYGRFAALLVERNREALVPAIASAFRAMLDRERGVARLQVRSARELPQEALDGIARAWKAETGASSVVLETKTDSALLGGFILRAGSVRYDWSTAGRFGRLGRELARPADAPRE